MPFFSRFPVPGWSRPRPQHPRRNVTLGPVVTSSWCDLRILQELGSWSGPEEALASRQHQADTPFTGAFMA